MEENNNNNNAASAEDTGNTADHEIQNKDGVKKKNKKAPAKISIFAAAVIAAACCVLTFSTTCILLTNNFNNTMRQYVAAVNGGDFSTATSAKLAALDYAIRSEYLKDIDDEALANSVLKGYMSGLGDRYADYYSAEEFAALMEDTQGEMQGIGISVVHDTDTQTLQIIAVFPDSPALKAGVSPGDRIAYVKSDGEYKSVAELGYQATLNALQGKADTYAEFVAYSDGNPDKSQEYSIKRGYITEITVEGRIYELDSSVGIISINSFDAKTPEQFANALETLKNQGASKLILDVRNNPGGELVSVCTILDSLLPEGPVIRTVDKDGNEETVYTSDKNEINMPMAVLANGNTASAGELFTAALKDYNKAVFVGTQTFGKGSMQTIRSFADGSGYKFTYRFYCPPFSDNYDGVGITPDVEVELDEAASAKNFYTLTDAEDNQLTAAYEQIKNK